jgi:hypothetical protein
MYEWVDQDTENGISNNDKKKDKMTHNKNVLAR